MKVRFWAKTGKGEFKADGQPYYHPVICHLSDTATVAMEIIRSYLSKAAIETLERGLGLSGDSLIRCCGFFAGSHDLGKISPAFQYQRSEVAEVLAGGQLYDLWNKIPTVQRNEKAPHGLVTAKTLPEFLIEIGIEKRIANKLAAIVGGHHGFFPSAKDIKALDESLAGVNQGNIWGKYSRQIFEELREFVKLQADDLPNQCDNAAVMILAGLTTVSDWIASNSDFFPYANDEPFEEYAKELPERAKKALDTLGWTKLKLATGNPLKFTELFTDIQEPRELQNKAIEIAKILTTPCLMLVEASMGEGKTEAAIYLADYLQQAKGTGGFYIGLPTQATSNAMFERVRKFLNTRYPEGEFPGLINLTLSHSAAALKEDYLQSICRLDKEEQIYDEDKKVVAQEWHTARKRTMLSPYGVGTVDQALMGAIRSKHQFVRLFGLAGRVVILDEIHAYDLYTSTLLERFLEWLALLGSPVIALSATLPVDTRRRLVNAYARGCGCEQPELPIGAYPRLTTFTQSGVTVDSFPASPHVTRSLNLHWTNDRDWIAELQEKLATDGGCVAVICSTVARAQEVFQRLQGQFAKDELGTELGLFHGRFLFIDRERIEQDCITRFGKPSDSNTTRPHRYVLVATQVIEQSLDLDFDLMISDLAPIDLLLQRSGRLHRHPDRENRPKQLSAPTMWLISPTLDEEGTPDFGVSKYIYDRHVLLRTWLATRHLKRLELPAMMDDLIESVYDLECSPSEDLAAIHVRDWHSSFDEYNDDRKVYERLAQEVRLPPARESNKPDQFTRQGDEDDDNTIAAVTRLGEKSISTIFLQQTSSGLALPSGDAIDLKAAPNLATVRSLLGHSTRISKRGLVEELERQERPKAWTSALLKYCRYVVLDANGEVEIGKWKLRLDPHRGVVIEDSN
jgi:CRISPR-associated endonuclease/helicase Cas3